MNAYAFHYSIVLPAHKWAIFSRCRWQNRLNWFVSGAVSECNDTEKRLSFIIPWRVYWNVNVFFIIISHLISNAWCEPLLLPFWSIHLMAYFWMLLAPHSMALCVTRNLCTVALLLLSEIPSHLWARKGHASRIIVLNGDCPRKGIKFQYEKVVR